MTDTIIKPALVDWPFCDDHAPIGAEPWRRKAKCFCSVEACEKLATQYTPQECKACKGYIAEYGPNGHWPSHEGSRSCGMRSMGPIASIAAGGESAHCTCDSCW